MRDGERTLIGNLIVVGTSAGGYSALVEILSDLSADIPAAIVILLHMPIGAEHSLEDSLRRAHPDSRCFGRTI